MITTYRKLLLAALTSATLLFALAGVTAANTGNVAASETCSTWSVSVSLNHNVTSDRTVVVVTTIPGTAGIAGNHYDTSFGQIWSVSGPAPATGTVTLEIYVGSVGSSLEYTTSASIAPAVSASDQAMYCIVRRAVLTRGSRSSGMALLTASMPVNVPAPMP